MSSTYLYADNDAIYDMSVSSTGTVLSYTDITTRVPLPSIQANANKYLKVRNDGQNLEWVEVEIGGGLELILDERTTINPPSVCFEDTAGTKYNTGINMYRDTTNANKETISLYTNNAERLKINEDAVIATRFRAGDGINTTPSYSFSNSNGTDTGMYYLFDSIDRLRFTANNTLVLEMNSGQSFFGTRLLCNLSTGNNTTPSLTFHNDSSTTGYSGQRTNASSDPRLWAVVNGVQSTELTTTQFSIGTVANNKNLIVNGNVEAHRYRAGNGTVGQPAFSFTTASGNDTGLYYQPAGDNVDRLVITVGNSGKFTIRETIPPAVRGITTHINDLIQEGDLNVTVGATNLTGGNVTIGTSGGTTRNLTVNGDLSVSGSITGSFPVPNNIGNPCLSSTELRFTAVLDADINVPHFVGCYCSQLLGGGKITITMKNLGASGLGKTFYVFRSSGDTTNPVQITNDSGQDIYLYNWNNVSKYEQFYLLSNGLSSTIIDVAAGSNSNFSWWKFVYMTINEQNRWIGKQLASCWDN